MKHKCMHNVSFVTPSHDTVTKNVGLLTTSSLHCIMKEDIKTALFEKHDLNRLSRVKIAKKNVVECDGVTCDGVTTPPMQNPLISLSKSTHLLNYS